MMFPLTILTTMNSDAKRMQLRGTLLPAGVHVHASTYLDIGRDGVGRSGYPLVSDCG
jgi:hypothetical protein